MAIRRPTIRTPAPWTGGTTFKERQAAGADWRRELGVPRRSSIIPRDIPVGGGRMHGTPAQPDYLAQFNAWTDPNISGVQPGAIQSGWGGFGSLTGSGTNTMLGIKMNDWLNTLPVGGERERAMNALGYDNGGNPFVPQVAPGTNRYWRQAAQNPGAAGYTAPGIYQQMNPENTGYIGVTNITGQPGNLTGQYTPFDVNARGGAGAGRQLFQNQGRPAGGPPGGPRRNWTLGTTFRERRAAGPDWRQELRPHAAPRRGPRGNFGPGGMPNEGVPGAAPEFTGGEFLPMTPEYEAARRQAEDQYAASLADINYQRAQIPGMVNMFGARTDTDRGLATDAVNEDMIRRGIYQSGITPQAIQEQVTTPFSRDQQDFQLQMQQLAQELAMQEGQAGLGYNQALMEALLNRGAQLAEETPYSIPGQFVTPDYYREPNRPNRPRRRPRRGGR